MGGRFKRTLRTGRALVIAGAAVLAAAAGASAANERTASLGGVPANEHIAFITVGEPARAPSGGAGLCVE